MRIVSLPRTLPTVIFLMWIDLQQQKRIQYLQHEVGELKRHIGKNRLLLPMTSVDDCTANLNEARMKPG